MSGIIIRDSIFSFEAIKKDNFKNPEPIFADAFAFCKAWLKGEKLFMLQTSGSTGLPKNILVTREQMASSAKATKAFFKLRDGCDLLCCLDTSKIAGKMMLVRAMEWQSRLILVPPSANPLLGLEKWNFDFVAMVPLQVQTCFEDEMSRKLLDQIRILIIGGAPSAQTLIDQVRNLKGKVYQTYGMTETVSHIALADLKQSGPIKYEALKGVTIAQDGEGKLKIKAPMTSGNWITAEDIVEMQGENQFIWKGRSDFVINSGGIKLHPEEIEKEIDTLIEQFFPGSAYIVIGMEHPKLGQALSLLVEGKGNQVKEKKLLDAAKATLQKFHVPKTIVFVPNFVRTTTGKVNRIETSKKCI